MNEREFFVGNLDNVMRARCLGALETERLFANVRERERERGRRIAISGNDGEMDRTHLVIS